MQINEGQQVVVAYDFSTTSEVALSAAITLAARAPQHVLHVVVAVDDDHRVPGLPTDKVDYHYTEKVHEHLTGKLTTIFQTSAPDAEIHFFVHVRIGKPAKEILGLAEQIGADLIVIGSHGWRGLARVLFGSVSEAVVRGAGCPVMVARPKVYKKAELVEMMDTSDQPHHQYKRPHRYSYSDNRVVTRPNDWPLM